MSAQSIYLLDSELYLTRNGDGREIVRGPVMVRTPSGIGFGSITLDGSPGSDLHSDGRSAGDSLGKATLSHLLEENRQDPLCATENTDHGPERERQCYFRDELGLAAAASDWTQSRETVANVKSRFADKAPKFLKREHATCLYHGSAALTSDAASSAIRAFNSALDQVTSNAGQRPEGRDGPLVASTCPRSLSQESSRVRAIQEFEAGLERELSEMQCRPS